jgi:hypothetical protein
MININWSIPPRKYIYIRKRFQLPEKKILKSCELLYTMANVMNA